jgi:cytoplasmic polyadenylation element-binding protein
MDESPLVTNPNNPHSQTQKLSTSTSTTTQSTLMVDAKIINDCSSSVSSLSSASSQSSTSCNSLCPPTLTKSNSTSCVDTQSTSNFFIRKSPSLENRNNLIQNDAHLSYNPYHSNSNLLALIAQQGPPPGMHTHNHAIENAAKQYRCAAQISEATCSWKGKLPPKQYKTPIVYSTKVFVGGLPWDIQEDDLIKEFGQFGPCRVEWTNKEKYNLLGSLQQNDSQQQQQQPHKTAFRNYRSAGSLNGGSNGNSNRTSDPLNSSKQRSSPGFAYVIFDNEYSVRALVGNCIEDYANGRDRVEYYFKISTRRVRNKEVQIIPWILADNNFALCTPKELDPKKTVFVGNLHGTMTARDLAHIMNELFGCVVYAGIDIDKLKYPIGSGRVTFSHQQNFMRAVRAAFVDIQTSKFSKRIQIDPYLEDIQCCICYQEKGIYFCRDFQCFNYYCGSCWQKQHSFDMMGNHKPLMRKREDKM